MGAAVEGVRTNVVEGEFHVPLSERLWFGSISVGPYVHDWMRFLVNPVVRPVLALLGGYHRLQPIHLNWWLRLIGWVAFGGGFGTWRPLAALLGIGLFEAALAVVGLAYRRRHPPAVWRVIVGQDRT